MLFNDRSVVEDLMIILYNNDGKENKDAISPKKIYATFERINTHPENLWIDVFKEHEEIIGYALSYSFWSNEYGGMVLTLDELYVRPSFRNRGISTQYIQTLENKCSSHVLVALEVMPGNDKAKSLYSRLGFTENKRTFMNKRI